MPGGVARWRYLARPIRTFGDMESCKFDQEYGVANRLAPLVAHIPMTGKHRQRRAGVGAAIRGSLRAALRVHRTDRAPVRTGDGPDPAAADGKRRRARQPAVRTGARRRHVAQRLPPRSAKRRCAAGTLPARRACGCKKALHRGRPLKVIASCVGYGQRSRAVVRKAHPDNHRGSGRRFGEPDTQVEAEARKRRRGSGRRNDAVPTYHRPTRSWKTGASIVFPPNPLTVIASAEVAPQALTSSVRRRLRSPIADPGPRSSSTCWRSNTGAGRRSRE